MGQLLTKRPRTEDTTQPITVASSSATSAICPTMEPVPAEGQGVPDPEDPCLAWTAGRRCKHQMVLTLKVLSALGDPLPHQGLF